MRSRQQRVLDFVASAKAARQALYDADCTTLHEFDREVALRVARELEFERDDVEKDAKPEAPREDLSVETRCENAILEIVATNPGCTLEHIRDVSPFAHYLIHEAKKRLVANGRLLRLVPVNGFATYSIPTVTPETDANGDRGSGKGWMGTSTGKKFWPLAPRPEDVDVRDIARGLAMTCRYGGQVKRYYSVAEHCVLVSRHVAPELALKALFHDSAEAYIGDMIRPLKHQPEMKAFRDAEVDIEASIFTALGFVMTTSDHDAIKVIDDRILIDEICALSARPDYYLSTPLLKDKQALGVPIHGWTPARAEAEFKQRYFEVCGIDLDNLKDNHP